MSERFENSIRDWYENSRTADLEYLDLAKPTIQSIEHNLSVVYDRLLLHSKVSIKDFYELKSQIEKESAKIQKQNVTILKNQKKLLSSLEGIENEVYNHKPLGVQEVKELVQELIKAPKEVEKEAVHLLEKLQSQIQEINQVVSNIKAEFS